MQQLLLTHMMNSLGWQTTDATPPMIIQGLITVWPPVTEVPPSSAASRNPRIISGITRSRSCVMHIDDTVTGYLSSPSIKLALKPTKLV